MKLRFVLLILLLLGVGVHSFAQKEIATQTNGWFMYFGNHRLNDQWGVHTEYQWRRHELIGNWQQSLLRLGVDYHVTNNSFVTAGYAWVESYPYGEQPIPESFTEHRLWEQWMINQRVGILYVNHRYRLEQRWLERPADNEYVFRQRARYRLLLTLPLGGRNLADHSFFAATYTEPFISFGKGVGQNILGQNRLYLALGYRFNADVNLQLGYLNQYIVKSDGIRHERNHNLQVGLTYNLDFRQ